MACYDNIVGIRGMCESPAIRYYVDDYGVSLKTAANIADERYHTGRRLFEAKKRQAWQLLLQDVEFRGYKHDRIIKGFSIVSNADNVISGNGVVSFDFSDNCELTGVFIDLVKIDVATGGAAVLSINGEQVYSGTLAVGVTEIQIGAVYPKILTIEISGAITVNGGKADYFKDAVGCSTISETYGMSITGDYRCNIENYLCRFPDKIGMALAIKTAALMTKEMLLTTKLAEVLFVKDRGELATDLAMLDSDENLYQYDGGDAKSATPGKYQRQLDYINRTLPIPKCLCCMEAMRSQYLLSIP